jgi:uncharacterized phage protein gp47/JayE
MALDPLPGTITVKSRDEWRDHYLRSYRLRDPDADTKADTQPWIDASCLADQLVILSENARQIGRKIPLSELSTEELDQRAAELGIPPRFPELGSSGAVTITASTSGTHLFAGDELTTEDSSVRFQCLAESDYADGDSVPIAAIDTGPTTNLTAGTQLLWSAPRPGCAPGAIVVEQTDGGGTSGGRIAESDDELMQRISDTLADPAATGNSAAYIRFAENSRGHGVPVQKAFAYPAILGPGTMGVAFTLKPATAGASRLPNATQIQQVRDYVVGQMPGDDQYLDIVVVAQPVNIAFDVRWASGAADWEDTAPFPERRDAGAGAVVVSAATDSTHFTLATDNGSYAGVRAPIAGQTIGFFNGAGTGSWARKRILSITGTGPWAIVVDTSNGVSDTAFVPAIGARPSPWSDSLADLIRPTVEYFGTIGPGEQRAVFFDPGVRERRYPSSPRYWPSTVSNRLAGAMLDIDAVPSVADAVVREGLGVSATVGTPGGIVYLLELGDLSAFPLT